MTDRRIAGTLKRISPPWLQRTRGGGVLGAFGDVLDDVLERSALGVRARFPGDDGGESFSGDMATVQASSIPVIGRQRRISRGPSETDAVYAARLRRWWTDHQRRGGAVAMLRQLEAFWAAAPKTIHLLYPSGQWWTLDTDGTITRSTHSSNADLTRWARLLVVYDLDSDPNPISYADYLAYMQVPREWSAAHVLTTVVAMWPGGEIWTDDGLWEDDGTLWAGGTVISDLYPDGAPPPEALEISGYPVTIDGETMTVTT